MKIDLFYITTYCKVIELDQSIKIIIVILKFGVRVKYGKHFNIRNKSILILKGDSND